MQEACMVEILRLNRDNKSSAAKGVPQTVQVDFADVLVHGLVLQ